MGLSGDMVQVRMGCAHCGSTDCEPVDMDGDWAVTCNNCKAWGPERPTRDEALEGWRERSQSEELSFFERVAFEVFTRLCVQNGVGWHSAAEQARAAAAVLVEERREWRDHGVPVGDTRLT